jgi:hypothetical protein
MSPNLNAENMPKATKNQDAKPAPVDAGKSKAPVKPLVRRARAAAALHDGKSLLSKAVRVDAEALETVLAGINMTADNKARARAVLVDGRTMRDVAREDHVSAELVSSVVRRVRAQLTANVSPWTMVTVPLTLPLTLAEELRGFVDAVSKLGDQARAESLLRDVLKATALAKAQAL